MIAVATITVLPRHHWVVLELVEPSTDQRVAALNFVVQESEWQITIHGFNPKRESAELNCERVEIHCVDATLYHMPTQARLKSGFEIRAVRCARYLLLAQSLGWVVAAGSYSKHPN